MSHLPVATAFACMLLFTNAAFGQQSEMPAYPVIFTEQNRQACLKENDAAICNSFPTTTEDEIAAINAKRAAIQRQLDLLKPDPRTPRFNACAEKFHENYHYVLTSCDQELREDLGALRSWWSPTTEASIEARHNVDRRLAEMKRVAEKKSLDRENEVRDRRSKMTASEKALDRLQEAIATACVNARSEYGTPCN